MKKYTTGAFLIFLLAIASCHNRTTGAKTAADTNTIKGAGWKIGIALFSFHRHPFPTAIAMADSAGVESVEGFSFYKLGPAFNDSTMGRLNPAGIDLMKKLLQEKGIKMTSMYVDGARNEQDWEAFFELGKSLDLRYLVCEPSRAHWDMIDSLAAVYKIKIAIHEHAKGISAYWHPDSVLAAIKGHSNIGACADLGHWARSGLNPVECLKKLDGHIIGLHLKDVAELNNPRAQDVNPGSGVIDFAAVVKELKRQRFNGYVQVECEHNLDNNLADVKEAIRYLKSLAEKQD